jgi:hypothetical protein
MTSIAPAFNLLADLALEDKISAVGTRSISEGGWI